jgi:hypothetical protein
MAESDGAIWRRLDEHGEQIGDIRRHISDLATRDATRQADIRAMAMQIDLMRDAIRDQATESAARHGELMRRLDTLAAARVASDAVRDYKTQSRSEAAKWIAIIVTILIALGIISSKNKPEQPAIYRENHQ